MNVLTRRCQALSCSESALRWFFFDLKLISFNQQNYFLFLKRCRCPEIIWNELTDRLSADDENAVGVQTNAG